MQRKEDIEEQLAYFEDKLENRDFGRSSSKRKQLENTVDELNVQLHEVSEYAKQQAMREWKQRRKKPAFDGPQSLFRYC